MGHVDDIQALFPVVDRAQIKQLLDALDNPTPTNIAKTLDRAKALGKVPDRDYQAMLAENVSKLTGDEDPLEEPPDTIYDDQTRNRMRAEKAMRWAENNQIDDRAAALARHGEIPDLVEFLNTVDQWANEAMLSPDRNTMPQRFNHSITLAVHAIEEIVEGLAHDRDEAALQEARTEVQLLRNTDLRESLTADIDGLRSLLEGAGGELDVARHNVLNEALTPAQVMTKAKGAPQEYALTLEEYEQLLEDAQAFLEEVPPPEVE